MDSIDDADFAHLFEPIASSHQHQELTTMAFMQYTYTAVIYNPNNGSSFDVQIQAPDPSAAQFMLESQYGAQNVRNVCSEWPYPETDSNLY